MGRAEADGTKESASSEEVMQLCTALKRIGVGEKEETPEMMWELRPCHGGAGGRVAHLQRSKMRGCLEQTKPKMAMGGTGLPNTETEPNAEMRTIPLITAIQLDHQEMLQRRGKIKGPIANRQSQSRRWPEACQRGNLIAAAKPNRTWACTGRPFPSPSSLSLASPMQRASLPCQPSPALTFAASFPFPPPPPLLSSPDSRSCNSSSHSFGFPLCLLRTPGRRGWAVTCGVTGTLFTSPP